MTKAKISEYDATAANNTDVNGVNIAEGCPPSGMNNMGREIMAALKRFQTGADGDSVTVGGSLVVSGSVTAANTATLGNVDINGGTIDGATIGGASAAAGSFTTLNTSGAVVFNDAGADVDFRVEGDANAYLLFVDASADKVGIGTSSPQAPLHISGGIAGSLIIDGTDSIRPSTDDSLITISGGNATNSGANYSLFGGTHATLANIHRWRTGGTERMRIDSNGNLLVGGTTPTNASTGRGNIVINGANTSILNLTVANLQAGYLYHDGTNLNLSNGKSGHLALLTNDTERMRITSSGNVGIGTSSPVSELHVADTAANAVLRLESSSSGAGTIFFDDQDATNIGIVSYDHSDNSLRFGTSSSERARIDSSGNLLLGGTSTPTASVGNLVMFNGTAPTGNVTNGCTLFCQDVSSSSELKVRDEAGNVTTLSPHNFSMIPEGPSEDMAWAYYSERNGKKINVDMLKLARMVEKLTGEKLVYTD